MTGPVVQLRVRRIRAEVDRAGAQEAAQRYGFALVTDVTRQAFNRANIITPVRTGNLRTHNRHRVYTTATRVIGELFNDAEYSEAVHFGADPHDITPRRKRSKRSRRPAALKITVGGETIYRRKVRHPGQGAQPWLERAVLEVAIPQGFEWTPE